MFCFFVEVILRLRFFHLQLLTHVRFRHIRENTLKIIASEKTGGHASWPSSCLITYRVVPKRSASLVCETPTE